MANGTFSLGVSGKLEGQVVWSSVSNGSVENTSTVVAQIQARKSSNTATKGTFSLWLSVGSDNINTTYYGSIGSSWVTIGEVTSTIKHNDDGTGSVSITGKINGPTGTSLEGCTVEATSNVILDTIPRKTTLLNQVGTIGAQLNIQLNPASGTFLHTLKYQFGNVEERIVTQVSANPISWTPSNDLYLQMNSTFGVGTLTLYTYDNLGNLIGESVASLTLYANESECLPELTGTNKLVDINETTKNLTGNENVIVSGYSNGQVTFNALVKNYAGVKSLKLNGNDINYTTSAVGANILVSSTIWVNKLTSQAVSISLVDTRNYQLNHQISASELINYIPLTVNADFKRLTPTGGHVKLFAEGNYYNGSFGAIDNNLTLSWGVKLKKDSNYTIGTTSIISTITNNTYSLDIELENPLAQDGLFDYTKEYDFILYYKDKLVDTNVTDSITKGQGDLEIYNGAILIGGVVIFYDDEKFTLNSNGAFSRVGE